jgi:hypothetical protein
MPCRPRADPRGVPFATFDSRGPRQWSKTRRCSPKMWCFIARSWSRSSKAGTLSPRSSSRRRRCGRAATCWSTSWTSARHSRGGREPSTARHTATAPAAATTPCPPATTGTTWSPGAFLPTFGVDATRAPRAPVSVDWTVMGTHPLAGHYRSKTAFPQPDGRNREPAIRSPSSKTQGASQHSFVMRYRRR